MSAYRYTSGATFAVIAIAHAVRAIKAWPVHIGDASLPVSMSWVAVVVAGLMSIWACRDPRT